MVSPAPARRQLVAGLTASALLLTLAVLAAVGTLHLSMRGAAAATDAFERDLADVRAVRHAARDLRTAGRSYVANGDRLALVGARTVLAAATERLHDARFVTVVRDAHALAALIESSATSSTHDVTSFDVTIERATRTLELTSDSLIAAAHAELAARLDRIAHRARRGEWTAGVLTLVGLAALFGCVATFLRTVPPAPPSRSSPDSSDSDAGAAPSVLT